MTVAQQFPSQRPRIREWGLTPGVLPTGPLNAITDVSDVRVGHMTLIQDDDIRTGATAILPHGGNLFQDKVPAGVAVGNGFGKLETPIVLTNTLAVPRAADAILDWTLAQPGNEEVVSVNPVVGETNDARLNNVRRRALTSEMVLDAIKRAETGPLAEGTVGAGTGTVAFGWKGGIGTSSRLLPDHLGGYVVGALVQSNFGGVLQILGVPVGAQLGPHPLTDWLLEGEADGSIMMIVATDAPLSDRDLTRIARRALGGLARTGASMSNQSGDYAIAFSTADAVRRCVAHREPIAPPRDLQNELLSALFLATIEATEEAIYNSLFRATTVTGQQGVTVEALPLDRVMALIESYGYPVSGP
jgi:D-aminopeptidase